MRSLKAVATATLCVLLVSPPPPVSAGAFWYDDVYERIYDSGESGLAKNGDGGERVSGGETGETTRIIYDHEERRSENGGGMKERFMSAVDHVMQLSTNTFLASAFPTGYVVKTFTDTVTSALAVVIGDVYDKNESIINWSIKLVCISVIAGAVVKLVFVAMWLFRAFRNPIRILQSSPRNILIRDRETSGFGIDALPALPALPPRGGDLGQPRAAGDKNARRESVEAGLLRKLLDIARMTVAGNPRKQAIAKMLGREENAQVLDEIAARKGLDGRQATIDHLYNQVRFKHQVDALTAELDQNEDDM